MILRKEYLILKIFLTVSRDIYLHNNTAVVYDKNYEIRSKKRFFLLSNGQKMALSMNIKNDYIILMEELC